MAIKASDQITIVDLTDGYSVTLTSDAYTFPGTTNAAKAGSTTTQIIAMRGAEQVAATIDLTEIEKPSGVTVTKDTDATSPTLTISVTTAVNAPGIVKIPVHIGDVVINKNFSFAIAFTGSTGGTGAAATSIICGNEAVTIPCDKDGKTKAAMDITIPFAGYQGTTRKACTVGDPTLPSGITKKSNTAATTSADGSLVLTVAAGSTLGGTDSGTITLTFTCNSITFTKVFSWSKSITGATGATGGTGTAATSVICGNESVTIPCNKDGLVSAAQTITIPFAGYKGTARAACTVAVGTLPSGMTAGTNTAATTSADGSLTISVAASGTLGGGSVKSGEITLTFTCNSQTFVKKLSWAKAVTGATGATGAAGADAVTIVITSSAGTIFKNTSIVTTLTAHVYKAGAELTGTALSNLGTINWYKDGSETAAATGATLTINAGDVTHKATYEARLVSS